MDPERPVRALRPAAWTRPPMQPFRPFKVADGSVAPAALARRDGMATPQVGAA